MRTIGLFFSVIAAIALTGCQTMGAAGGGSVPLTTYKCTYDTDCAVTVYVTNTSPCVVSVDRSEIEMKGGWNVLGLTHLIRWQLDDVAADAKFRFDKDKGVVLKGGTQSDQFSGQGPQNGKLQYHWRDKNTDTKQYTYEINIEQKGSANTCKLDPMIYNN